MREVKISQNESGQRLDKYLLKYFQQASKSFLYKMLRKKNIKLNGKKAEGNEKLRLGDVVSIYFSDETFDKFRGETDSCQYPTAKLDILYEDDHIVVLNKPSGILSQKAKDSDTTLVEFFLGYLQQTKQWCPDEAFTPGICNRLDRNTSGVVIAGKSLLGLQKMSELLRMRMVDKYYTTIVEGVMDKPAVIRGYLQKDENTNKVTIYEKMASERSYIETAYEPLKNNGKFTLLRVKLITGKTHQIRSHLSSIGHPLMGDVKYGARKIQGEKHFYLHADKLVFPEMVSPFEEISGRVVRAPLPPEFRKKKEELFRK